MKICHLTSVHSHNDIRIFIKQCTSLASSGHDVHLIVPNTPDQIKNSVTIHGINYRSSNRLTRMIGLTRQVYNKALQIDADIYHFHDPELIPIGIKLKKKGKKVIYDVHEDVPKQILSKYWIPKYARSLVSWSFGHFENYASKKFHGIIAATPHISKRFKEIGCVNVETVNNFPLLHELNMTNVVKEKKGDMIVYVGGITNIRGIKEMVASMKNSPYQLVLAGKFSSQSEREAVQQVDGWDNVAEMGFLNRSEVAELLSKASAGLVLFHPYPNHIDAQPNKMFEYMSAGLPIISSNFPLWKEIVEGNSCGICVDPLNPTAIREAIEQIIRNPDDAAQMGRNGRSAVESKYNWETESFKLLKFYSMI